MAERREREMAEVQEVQQLLQVLQRNWTEARPARSRPAATRSGTRSGSRATRTRSGSRARRWSRTRPTTTRSGSGTRSGSATRTRPGTRRAVPRLRRIWFRGRKRLYWKAIIRTIWEEPRKGRRHYRHLVERANLREHGEQQRRVS